MAWPFERANALGYAMFELFTSADATLIDKNAAEAASGDIWTDVAQVVNFYSRETLASDVLGQYLMWEPVRRRWWNFGRTSGNKSSAYYSKMSGPWVASNLTVPAPTNWTAANSAAHDGNGLMLAGGTANDANKIRRSVDAGTTWTAQALNTAASAAVKALAWAPSCNLFVAGLDNGVVETSPDGITWTVRTTPDAYARDGVAVSPERIVMIQSSGPQNHVITSEDGITWTQRTLASTGQGFITYNEQRGLFMTSSAGKIQTSPDGINWTVISLTAAGQGSLVSIGRLFLRGGDTLYVSVDDGANWEEYAEFDLSGASSTIIAASPNQVVAVRDQTLQRSLFGGQ